MYNKKNMLQGFKIWCKRVMGAVVANRDIQNVKYKCYWGQNYFKSVSIKRYVDYVQRK